MKTPNRIRLALVAILALAALLRFQNLAAIQHNVDHAYPIWIAACGRSRRRARRRCSPIPR
jgi:hypothetical protein